MQITAQSSPHVRKPNARVNRMMGDVAIALSPLVVFAVFVHGLSGFLILLVSVASMVITEYLFYQYGDFKKTKTFKLKNESFTLGNYTVIVSGLIYGLILPDQIPLTVVAIGGAVGVFFAKLVFGGMGQNIFNIAGFARIFVVLAYGGVTRYVANVDATAGATALGILNNNLGADPTATYSLWTLFSGIGLPGSLGETSALLILVGGLYLLIRKSYDVFVPLTYLATVLVLSTAVMVFHGLNPVFPLVQLFGGGLMFAAIYMATDPVTMPVTRPGRIYYAFGIGLLTVLIRFFGNLPEGVVFAIVIMNMFVPAFDLPQFSKPKFTMRSASIFTAIVLIFTIITVWGVSYVL